MAEDMEYRCPTCGSLGIRRADESKILAQFERSIESLFNVVPLRRLETANRIHTAKRFGVGIRLNYVWQDNEELVIGALTDILGRSFEETFRGKHKPTIAWSERPVVLAWYDFCTRSVARALYFGLAALDDFEGPVCAWALAEGESVTFAPLDQERQSQLYPRSY